MDLSMTHGIDYGIWKMPASWSRIMTDSLDLLPCCRCRYPQSLALVGLAGRELLVLLLVTLQILLMLRYQHLSLPAARKLGLHQLVQ